MSPAETSQRMGAQGLRTRTIKLCTSTHGQGHGSIPCRLSFRRSAQSVQSQRDDLSDVNPSERQAYHRSSKSLDLSHRRVPAPPRAAEKMRGSGRLQGAKALPVKLASLPSFAARELWKRLACAAALGPRPGGSNMPCYRQAESSGERASVFEALDKISACAAQEQTYQLSADPKYHQTRGVDGI